MSTGFAFKQGLHLCSVSNLRILLVFQLRSFKVGFSGPKTFRGFRETGPRSFHLRFEVFAINVVWLRIYRRHVFEYA